MGLSKIKGPELYNNIIVFSVKYLALENEAETGGVHIVDGAVKHDSGCTSCIFPVVRKCVLLKVCFLAT